MKYAALSVLFLCFLFVHARADEPVGIRFFTGSWTDVLAEAKRQHKPIYVDFHTTWCPPCRRMAREAFPNPQVGEKFNEHFVSYQVDAELGEGFTLARQYAVSSYPTALFITPEGELVHRAVGYGGVNAMLKQADMVMAMPKMRRSLRKRGHPNSSIIAAPTLTTLPDSTPNQEPKDSLR
ncbi:thioredoxin family protein [Spirosoma soli]|uniref:Thioredoxin family protein n=1 Tax=Spirosoma soli TaxID=1770529 RepID=A0ABW5M6K3_9BACT